MLRRLISRWLQPTAIVFTGLNRGQTPHVAISYGRFLIVGFDLPTVVDVEPIRSEVLSRAFETEGMN